MFRVTEDWITRHPTKNGGYKASQLRLIGVSWPPKHGWKKRASGRLISMDDKDRFESYGVQRSAITHGNSIDTSCGCDVLPWEDCEHTEAATQRAMEEMLSLPEKPF